ncbi:MAG: TIGR02301 family protein [Hyphomicrobiaceae bacterium]|nr:TIGR02301 family protein [Hyphomicrobiaceae bacterium]
MLSALGASTPIAAQQNTQAQSPAAAAATSDQRPYDEKMLRLSEILGAVHFLRELCGNNDGMQWRDRMNDLLDAEGSSAARRVKFTRAFNAGYRGYSRTYTTCTTTARTAVTRFITEGTELSDGLMRGSP